MELIGEAADRTTPPETAHCAHEVARRADLFADRLMLHQFVASEDATLMLRAVAARAGLGGNFVLGSNLGSAHHTAQFDFDESVVSSGAAVIAALALAELDSGARDAQRSRSNSPEGARL
jgi:aminobenzoyl-glutamate utilization protein A